jgi:hypothetical protein
MLKHVTEMGCEGLRLDWIDSEWSLMVGFSEHGGKISRSTKTG